MQIDVYIVSFKDLDLNWFIIWMPWALLSLPDSTIVNVQVGNK